MKAVVREHLEQLDINKGGGIISDKIRVDTIENPMLVIGIGGTGIDALLRLKYQINRRFRLPEDRLTKKKKDKPDKIEFLAFETNNNDKDKKVYKGVKLDSQSELVLLANAEIGGILQNRKTMDPSILEWLSPELKIEDGMNGANGKRQAGRLLLFTRITEVIQSIEKKITTLQEGSKEKLMVYILTGVSGGTGGGSFLDIAYIVRGIMERKYGPGGVDRVNILGYLFTPDVNLANKSLGLHQQSYIKKNGYAALKELDYWMNVGERGERFYQKYKDILTVNSPMPPFNLCHLISATNTEGKLLENAYEYCMDVTAENITNFMANEERQSGHEFAIHDYISNININIDNMRHPYHANYKYNIIGASSAILPIEEITTYLAFKLFKKMEKMFEMAPNERNVDDFIRGLKIDIESIDRRFQQEVREPIPGYKNSERFAADNVVKTQSVNMDNELQKFLSKAEEEYIKVRKQLPGQILREFEDQINRIFLNPAKGPFYASRLILSNIGFCTLKTLDSYIDTLESRLKKYPDRIDDQQAAADGKFTEARKALVFTKEKKKNDYIEAKIEEYYLRADEERTKRMLEFYQDLAGLINEKNNRIYAVFTETLDTLNRIFKDNGDILVSGKEVEHQGGKTYYWNVINVPDVVKAIEDILRDENEEELIRRFTAELLEESRKWVDEHELDIVGAISAFLTDKFGDLITRSMEDFLVMKYGQDESIDRIVNQKIAGRLDEDAIPVFNLSNSDGSLNLPSWGMVSVPMKAPSILKGIEDYQRNSFAKSNFTIKQSQITNRIFWLNTKNGVPLYAYTPLKVYEADYENTIFESEGVGRHLVQTPENNWALLPSPIPEKSWGDTYVNSRIKEYNCEIREMFNKAIAGKWISVKHTDNALSNKYECVVTKPFHLQNFLGQYDLQLETGKKPNITEITRCTTDLSKLLHGGLEQEYKRDIFNSFDEEGAKENFIRSPWLIKLVKTELQKREEIAEKIQELEQYIKAAEEQEKVYEEFCTALYTDTIVRKGALYVYDKETEEQEDWEPFVNLMKVKNYPEYEVFVKFCSLDKRQKAILMRKVDKRVDKLAALEDTTALLEKVDSLILNYAKCIEDLEYTRQEMISGEETYKFYKQVILRLKAFRRNFR